MDDADGKKEKDSNYFPYFRLHNVRPNMRHDNSCRRRQSTGTPNFPSTRVPRPSLNRSSQPTIYPNNRMNGQMFRERSDSNFSHIGEGGDVLINQRQCSVSTETDGTQTTDRFGNFDARIRTARIRPLEEEANDTGGNNSNDSNQKSKDMSSNIDIAFSNSSSATDEKCTKISEESVVKTKSSSVSRYSSDTKVPSTPHLPQQVLQGTAIEREELKSANEVDLKPVKKSSSLNPCAECFNPTIKPVVQVQSVELPSQFEKKVDYMDANGDKNVGTETVNLENSTVGQSENFIPQVDVAWDYEILEDDIYLEHDDSILYSNLQNVDSGENEAILITMSEIEDQDNFEREIYSAEQGLIDPVGYSSQQNGFLGTINEYDISPDLDNPSQMLRTNESKKCSSKSVINMAEGDGGVENEEVNPQGNPDSGEKQEEPGLNSACGDFVVSENNNVAENQENVDNNSENLQGTVDFPVIPLNNSVSNESQNRRFEEEIELNFACFSGSDSSEVDSSDISEEELSEESEEHELDISS
ncbi:hypothetical protein CDAR_41791 [Caerostris darwini]|uniref:Uncharacterized protein n=1 Tax=Caerostris darwini TaxID=1538125 RepID=A0AAV4WDV7_9ARAC|nr:hypothetical protein CDAR_41791 [Caerostris darwini]